MSTSNGLQIALELARTRRDDAAQALAETRARSAAARLQLEQLDHYRTECGDRWSERSARCTPDLLQHHYQFMDRLTHAIGLQTGVVAQHERNVLQVAGQLRDAEGRVQSLQQLWQTRSRERAQAEGRREQKQNDEQAALVHARRLASSRFASLAGLS